MKTRFYLKGVFFAALLPWLLIAAPSLNAEEGKALYSRCASCHLAGGEGVIGAYPPLLNRALAMAKTPLGRQYLVSVINTGLMGSIKVGNIPYNGFMPAQGHLFSADKMAKLLNHMIHRLNSQIADEPLVKLDGLSKAGLLFSANEVTELLKVSGSAQDNISVRRQLLTRHPALAQ